MYPSINRMRTALAVACIAASAVAAAKLPPLSPEQEKAAAEKKAQAAARAEKEKQELAASMEKISNRWRERAAQQGWKTSPATPVAAAPVAGAAPAPQPAAAQMPIRSEKRGTAPPSEDTKNPAEKGK